MARRNFCSRPGTPDPPLKSSKSRTLCTTQIQNEELVLIALAMQIFEHPLENIELHIGAPNSSQAPCRRALRARLGLPRRRRRGAAEQAPLRRRHRAHLQE